MNDFDKIILFSIICITMFLLMIVFIKANGYDHRIYFIYNNESITKIYIDDTANYTKCQEIISYKQHYNNIWSIECYGKLGNNRNGDYTPSRRRIRLYNINNRSIYSNVFTLFHELYHNKQHLFYGSKGFWLQNDQYLENQADLYAMNITNKIFYY